MTTETTGRLAARELRTWKIVDRWRNEHDEWSKLWALLQASDEVPSGEHPFDNMILATRIDELRVEMQTDFEGYQQRRGRGQA